VRLSYFLRFDHPWNTNVSTIPASSSIFIKPSFAMLFSQLSVHRHCSAESRTALIDQWIASVNAAGISGTQNSTTRHDKATSTWRIILQLTRPVIAPEESVPRSADWRRGQHLLPFRTTTVSARPILVVAVQSARDGGERQKPTRLDVITDRRCYSAFSF